MFRVLCLLLFVSVFELCCAECESLDKCGICLNNPDCVWCRKMLTNKPHEQNSNQTSGCMSRNEAKSLCYESFIEDKRLNFKVVRNDPLQTESAENRVLLTPQEVHLSNVKKGDVYNVTVTFKQAKDYPVDFYFLTDASATMVHFIKKELEKISKNLSQTLQSLTRDVSFGLGAFVDKNTPPYSKAGQSSYTFKNVQGLTNNMSLFSESIKNIEIQGNFDSAESALDAVLQATVCTDDLKWRNDARKIILVTTDAPTHAAGNGKLAGITKPNDGQCHLSNGYYTEDLKQDYASYGLLARKIQGSSTNVIFAVKFEVTYSPLANFTKGSVVVTKLDTTSTDLLKLVENQYRAIATSVQLGHNSSEFVKLSYYSSCSNGSEIERRECNNFPIGREINFTIGIEILKCPSNTADQRQTLLVKPYGYQSTLTLNIGFNCYCPCEKADNETCPTRCSDFKFCVECKQRLIEETESYSDNECAKCDEMARFVHESKPFDQAYRPTERRCEPIKDFHSGCETDIAYEYSDELKEIVVRYTDKQRCPEFPLAVTSFALMGGIVVAGIVLLLIWRLLLFLYDRKEYARFLEESKKANWSTGANPLYVNVNTTIQNPAFKSSPDELS